MMHGSRRSDSTGVDPSFLKKNLSAGVPERNLPKSRKRDLGNYLLTFLQDYLIVIILTIATLLILAVIACCLVIILS